MGLQGLFREIKLKKPPAKIRITRPLSSHPSHWNYYHVPKDLPATATWPTPSCPLLGKVCGPFLTLFLQGQYMPPTNQQVYPKTPSFPNQPGGQQEQSKTSPQLLCLWALKTDMTMCPGSALPDYEESAHCVNNVSSLNKLVFSTPCFESGQFFFHLRAETTILSDCYMPSVGLGNED